MRWQKAARLAIVTFVCAFAGVVFFTMRQRAATPEVTEEIHRIDPGAVLENPDGGEQTFLRPDGSLALRVSFKRHLGYADGRTKLGGVDLTLPDRGGRTINIRSEEADVITSGAVVGAADFRGNVRLTTSDGIALSSEEAKYNESEGIVTIPGAVEFSRGRMKGSGVGATYDHKRDVLWLLDKARVTIAPDATGAGAAEATAGAIGMARAEHYLRLTRTPVVRTTERTIEAEEITVLLRPEDSSIRQAQLRGSSRITAQSTADSMTANDIDLTYAEDGRTLQSAKLMTESVVQLPGPGGSARRITGRTIDMVMTPDGATISTLHASGEVEVDLPGSGDLPSRRIRAATLQSSGASGAGLEAATFEGGVEFVEKRPARGKLGAVERTARSQRLIVATKPGLGDLERAEFLGNVRFTDANGVTAEAPRAVYTLGEDRLELSPMSGVAGPAPTVSDDAMHVQARTIAFSPEGGSLRAETDVRSTIRPRQRNGRKGGKGAPQNPAAAGDQTRMPAILKPDRPVNVTANRLDYDGRAVATYQGNARLWQEQSKVEADTIVLDDSSGDLTARVNVATSMMLDDTDPKTGTRVPTRTTGTADTLVYDDDKRLAVYTGTETTPATMKGAQGDLSANRIELFLKESGSELERAEAYGRVGVQEAQRSAVGDRLTYTTANDTYVMTGKPVEVIDREEQSCKKTVGATLKFRRAVDTIQGEGAHGLTLKTETIACPAERRD